MSNFERVADLVESLRREGQLDTHGEALAEVSLTLARRLDDCEDRALASVARELRESLRSLMAGVSDGDDDWTSGVSAQVRNSSKS